MPELPLEGEDVLENAHAMIPEEEDTEDDVRVQYADESFSPEPIREDQEAEDEAGWFSPELLRGDENDEAINPEEDRAILKSSKDEFSKQWPAPSPSEDNLEMEAP